MDISVTVVKTADNSEAFRRALNQELAAALFASAKQVEREAKQSILSGQKTGRLYRRRTVTHQASAPGEAPASDTGRLVNSINSFLDRARLIATVVAGRGVVVYASMLEFGTRKMAARPFMFPAAEKSRAWIIRRVHEATNRAIAKLKK